jgi:hypothetical protein
MFIQSGFWVFTWLVWVYELYGIDLGWALVVGVFGYSATMCGGRSLLWWRLCEELGIKRECNPTVDLTNKTYPVNSY